jgi:M6 family metalloprotease-like protein
LLFALLLGGWGLLTASSGLFAQSAGPKNPDPVDLGEYRTVANAIQTTISQASPALTGVPAYLGIHAAPNAQGKLVVGHVEADSPAARAGLLSGDVLKGVNGQFVTSVDMLREVLQSKGPGDTIQVVVVRKDQTMELSAKLTAVSKALKLGAARATIGAKFGEFHSGLPIKDVSTGGAAAKAGLKAGDVLVKIDGEALSESRGLADILIIKAPGDVVTVLFRRDGKEEEVKVTLGGETEAAGGGKGGGGWDNRNLAIWKKPTYRLAIIGIEYADVKHNPKITAKDWEESMFSIGNYNKTSVTGQTVHGSMNDYYLEQSFKQFKIEGKMFEFVEVGKKRMDYSPGTGTGNKEKTALFNETIDKLLERDGKDALKDFDGIFFLYAGERVQTTRGGLYWPHRASFTHQGKRWPYFIVQEGGSKMNDISVFCHEFGHMLGLPDLYARPELPGSEGVGVWCAMSNQVGAGKPQHFCAWSKEQVGWIKPCLINPTVKQKLILAPIEDSPKECFKVLVKMDGSEYFLLENRKKKGFDASLPAEGLLIWRVVANRPVLEESHGVEGPAGPRVFLSSVPFPSPSNNAFTPYTTPSSRSQLGGGLPVHITNIRKLADGRITFHVGYEFL